MKHVWTHRGAVSTQLKPALAAQHRREVKGRPQSRRSCGQQTAGMAWVGTCSVFPGAIPGRSRLELLGRRRGQGPRLQEWLTTGA